MTDTNSGEFALIDRIAQLIGQRQGPSAAESAAEGPAPRLLLGIGDDCAVWQQGGVTQLATTDTMVDGVHFRRWLLPWRDLGWKALAVNVSDIAAMGGIPDYALITLGLPPETEAVAIDALYEGLQDCAQAFGVRLVGGDIVSAPAMFLSIALTGRASSVAPFPNNVLLRSTARPGDAIAVTGSIGLAAAGLRLMFREFGGPAVPAAIAAHCRPQPRLAAGRLALEAGVRCGMDISDGLVGDLEKLCRASGMAAELALKAVPVDPGVKAAYPAEWVELALAGGEDYELLLIAPAEVLDAVHERSDVPVTIIGRVVPGEPGQVTVRDAEGRPIALQHTGWDHLAQP